MSQLFKITALFYGLSVFCIPVFGQVMTQKKRLFIVLGPIWSAEDFRWSIAGNAQGTGPDVLSELNFTQLKRACFCVEGRYQYSSRFSLKATAASQYGYSGRVTDIDYAGDNRSMPVMFLQFRSKKNNTRNYEVQCSYQMFRSRTVSVAAGAGYFISKADYRMQGRPATDIKGIYNAQWRGPLVCTETRIFLPQNWEIRADINGQYHAYRAGGDWRLRSDFRHPLSFVHRAKGWGIRGTFGLNYPLSSQIGLQLKSSLLQWKTGAGSDLLYMADGSEVTTRMNESVRTQWGIGLGSVFSF